MILIFLEQRPLFRHTTKTMTFSDAYTLAGLVLSVLSVLPATTKRPGQIVFINIWLEAFADRTNNEIHLCTHVIPTAVLYLYRFLPRVHVSTTRTTDKDGTASRPFRRPNVYPLEKCRVFVLHCFRLFAETSIQTPPQCEKIDICPCVVRVKGDDFSTLSSAKDTVKNFSFIIIFFF